MSQYRPPIVRHFNSIDGENHLALVQEVVDKFSLKREEAKLLALYAACHSGFAPSKKYIEDKTGIGANHICRARSKLVNDHFIGYSKSFNEIWIDWAHLRGLASVPKDMVASKKHRYIGAVNPFRGRSYIEKYGHSPRTSSERELMMLEFVRLIWGIDSLDDDILYEIDKEDDEPYLDPDKYDPNDWIIPHDCDYPEMSDEPLPF